MKSELVLLVFGACVTLNQDDDTLGGVPDENIDTLDMEDGTQVRIKFNLIIYSSGLFRLILGSISTTLVMVFLSKNVR